MRTHDSRWVMVVIGFSVLCGSTSVVAAEERQVCPICSKANNTSATYGERAGNTLARGALNMTLGWTELIRQPAKKARKGGNVFLGIVNGVGKSFVRTARGVGEVLTFWAVKKDDGYVHLSNDCPLDTMQ